ncbi:hypothetical protein [Pseudalkalibacillus hwajinpoensis]|uniref:hypothetical protein n=1 Tax=Guptibacillus hwajinpoensis TaxID=208199 RepID=UPI001CD39461|nr:hypothetical protein [Pseudalkalibacillus hwajinpoensis]MCA0993274.1 hypothetical protein [Pseudalkalibacillus hwajinpoensis]
MNDRTKSLLSQLPIVKDERSKATIYENIEKKRNEQMSRTTKKKTPWIIPGIAAVVVLLLAVLITPGLFNQNNNDSNIAITQSSNESRDNSSYSASDSKAETTTLAPAEEKTSDTKEEEVPTFAEEPTVFDSYIPAFQQSDGISVIISYPDPESTLLVPLSFPLDESKSTQENIEFILTNFRASDYGLERSPLTDATFELTNITGKETLIVSFPEPGDGLSSTESIMINDSVQQLAKSLGADQINWQTNGENGYTLGNFGNADPSVNKKPSPYFLYKSRTESHFLVNGPALQGEEGAEMDVALSLMKDGDQSTPYYLPSIPATVAIYSFDGNGSEASIAFTEESKFQSEEEAMQTIEALMLVASQYDYQTIRFENTGFDKIGRYSLNKPLTIPSSPNAVELN